jgi:hypothetical protein
MSSRKVVLTLINVSWIWSLMLTLSLGSDEFQKSSADPNQRILDLEPAHFPPPTLWLGQVYT